MNEHTGIVVLGEPDQATSALYERTLGTVFSVLTVRDEATLLELLRSQVIAAVVVEPALFTRSRWDQLELVGRACARARVPLLICSTQDERRRGYAAGAAAYLVKPILPATLLEAVRQVITSAGA
jgi:DNA-binding response OmpR family regulator